MNQYHEIVMNHDLGIFDSHSTSNHVTMIQAIMN